MLMGSYVNSCEEQFLRADLTTLMSTTVNFQRVSTLLRVDPVPPVPFQDSPLKQPMTNCLQN